MLKLLHCGFFTLALSLHLLLYHGFAIVHLVACVSREAEIGLVAEVRQVSRLLCRDQLLHLGLLLNLLEVNSVVTFKTVVILTVFPEGSQVINLGNSWLRHAVEHLLGFTTSTRRPSLLIFRSLLLHHILIATTVCIIGLLGVIFVVS